MKKYILLIVLISFVSQLQAAAGEKKTLSVMNDTTYTYTVNYTANGQKFTVPLSPGAQQELDHNVTQITEMTYFSNAPISVTRTVTMESLQEGGQTYDHVLITIKRYAVVGVSYYGVGPDPNYYIEAGLKGFVQGLTGLANFLSTGKAPEGTRDYYERLKANYEADREAKYREAEEQYEEAKKRGRGRKD